MFLVAHLSDCHLDGSPARRDVLAGALAYVTGGPRLPDVVVVSGDIADTGAAAEYAQASEVLAASPVPVLTVPGNHDERAAYTAGLPAPGPADRSGTALDRVAVLDTATFVLLDSTVPGEVGGRLGAPSLDTLARALDDAERTGDRPVFVVLHHPPVAVGDVGPEMALSNPDELAAVLDGRPGATAVLAGHVHAGLVTTLGATPVLVAPALWAAGRYPWEPPLDGTDFDPDARPAVAFHVLGGDGVLTSHVRPLP